MKPTFKIEAAEPHSHHNSLLLFINPDVISSVIIGTDHEFVSIHSYHLPQDASAETTAIHLKQILSHENVLKNEVNNTCVIYGYPSAVLAPESAVNETSGKMMMEMMHGEISDAVLKTDNVKDRDIKAIYTVPKQVDSVISFLFSNDCSKHVYSLLAAVDGLSEDCMYCIFGSSYFTAMLIKGGQMQLVQSYPYKTPEDAAYYLLQMCHSYHMNTNTIRVNLNGMISAGSNLYNGISKYFLNMDFSELPQGFSYPESIKDYPAHYFSHLLTLVKCVS